MREATTSLTTESREMRMAPTAARRLAFFAPRSTKVSHMTEVRGERIQP